MMSSNNNNLFEQFPNVSYDQWIAQIIQDLKGKDFNQTLTYTTSDNIHVGPVYNAQNTTAIIAKPLFNHTDWHVTTEIDGTDEQCGNKQLLQSQLAGVTGFIIYVFNHVNLNTLLANVNINNIKIQFVVEGNAEVITKSLNDYCLQQSLAVNNLKIAINTDPIENLLRTGNWRNNQGADEQELDRLLAHFPVLCINANRYQLAGASPGFELACIVAQVNFYLNQAVINTKNINTLQINVAVGGDYFIEIAKLRALRKIIALLLNEHGLKIDVNIHAETSTINYTLLDEYNNILRATTSAMAATIGGCNSLTTKPFDSVYQTGNEFSERIARNIQHLLKHESYFNQLADVAAGSYFIEYLTEELAQKAWLNFTQIEKQGGMFNALKNGFVQQQIQSTANNLQEQFNSGKIILVGTNKFVNPKQQKLPKQEKSTPSKKSNTLVMPLQSIRLSKDIEKSFIASNSSN